ncbi:guanylate kinase [Paenibacillus psychroresistens]|uniref:Guanylate kinase n=1 Tax=Paenibacillus psychroresistens TaxID=1778678 RepID=A0A6B8RPT3_9BACL|nr:guanylate kinase [Paenibacillus psychroresistens]QGQ97824.1 guanylate kinase [Paenibacillus psychroresistens]
MIFIFTGTSGSGRKTVARKVCEQLGIKKIVSYTTREPRSKEVEGTDYYFISRAKFIADDLKGEFFQTAEIDHIFYGTKKVNVQAIVDENESAYLIVNRSGANRIKFEFKEQAVRLFIYVQKQTVRERLEARGESFEVIEHYMQHYTEEVTYRKDCEHVYENIDLSHTLELVKQTMEEHLLPQTTE